MVHWEWGRKACKYLCWCHGLWGLSSAPSDRRKYVYGIQLIVQRLTRPCAALGNGSISQRLEKERCKMPFPRGPASPPRCSEEVTGGPIASCCSGWVTKWWDGGPGYLCHRWGGVEHQGYRCLSGKVWFIIQIQCHKSFSKIVAYALSLSSDAKAGLFQLQAACLV